MVAEPIRFRAAVQAKDAQEATLQLAQVLSQTAAVAPLRGEHFVGVVVPRRYVSPRYDAAGFVAVEHVARLCFAATERAWGSRFPNGRDADGQRTVPGVGIAPGDGGFKLSSRKFEKYHVNPVNPVLGSSYE